MINYIIAGLTTFLVSLAKMFDKQLKRTMTYFELQFKTDTAI